MDQDGLWHAFGWRFDRLTAGWDAAAVRAARRAIFGEVADSDP